ncbi:hypothetical protein [Salipaludibacillus daqingensis]|uniref:hypothetical protein n=1 Tax=Salipaludibacillus daqingensis TaxID=3041001 RepID=UPI002475D38B|nr:hypothetical protein [Salipaludibacillus daqingensis]
MIDQFKLTFGLTTLLIAGVAIFFFVWEDELKRKAKAEAISLVSELNGFDSDTLTVDSVDHAKEYGSYAVAVSNKESKTFQVAVILNEQQDDIHFAIDVTDTYDKYGLAYCH